LIEQGEDELMLNVGFLRDFMRPMTLYAVESIDNCQVTAPPEGGERVPRPSTMRHPPGE
jgi:hypothetical protein